MARTDLSTDPLPRKRPLAKLILKLVVSVALFAVILSRIDLGGAGKVLAGVDFLSLALAFVLSLLLIVTDGLLWRSVLRALGHRISLGPAMTYSIVGSFFGVIGPSFLGIDIFRAAQMRRLGVAMDTAVRTVVATRLASLACLLVIILSGLPITLDYDLGRFDKAVLISIIVAGAAALAGLLLLPFVPAPLRTLQRFPAVRTAFSVSRDLAKALKSSPQAPACWFHAALMHLIRTLTFVAIAGALGTSVGFGALYALVPVALLVAMVPISLGSWGVREASVIYFLSWAGVSAETALSMSLIFGGLRLLVSSFGGIVWLIARPRHYNLDVAEVSD